MDGGGQILLWVEVVKFASLIPNQMLATIVMKIIWKRWNRLRMMLFSTEVFQFHQGERIIVADPNKYRYNPGKAYKYSSSSKLL